MIWRMTWTAELTPLPSAVTACVNRWWDKDELEYAAGGIAEKSPRKGDFTFIVIFLAATTRGKPRRLEGIQDVRLAALLIPIELQLAT